MKTKNCDSNVEMLILNLVVLNSPSNFKPLHKEELDEHYPSLESGRLGCFYDSIIFV